MKNRCLFVVCVSIIILSYFSAEVQATSTFFSLVAQNRNSISGQVFDSQRRPVTQIYVELQNDVYSILARTKTDGSGRFFFNNVSAGRFYIRVLPYGTNLEEQTQEVEIVNFVSGRRSASENAQKDFYLRLRRDGKETTENTGVIFAQDIPEEAQKLYKKALGNFEDNEVEAGIEQLQNALKLFPDYYLALERLGYEFIKQQKFQNAQEIYRRAVAINARSFTGWYRLSYASYALQKSETAIEAAEKAVALNAQSFEAFLMLGVSERQAKLYDRAEKSLRQADKLADGKAADVHWNLALLYAHNFKRYDAAADELELYLKAEPKIENAEMVRKLIRQFREKSEQK